MLKTALAIATAKTAAWLIRFLKKGSGSSLPGKLALRLSPTLLHHLTASLPGHRIVITGTNGKSTTAGLIAAFFECHGSVVHNQLGANMLPGLVTALCLKATLLGKINAQHAVLEVDEASLPKAASELRQHWTVVTNLFRDQLDRYGELDTTAKLIAQGIKNSGGKLLLNADDPLVAHLGHQFPPGQVFYYGVDAVQYPTTRPPEPEAIAFHQEVTDCPLCSSALVFTTRWYGHLGHYHCPSCSFKRPTPHVTASQIEVGIQDSQITLNTVDGFSTQLRQPLPGIFNAYNLLAAVAIHQLATKTETDYQQILNAYQSLFGRAEVRTFHDRPMRIFLIKTPREPPKSCGSSKPIPMPA